MAKPRIHKDHALSSAEKKRRHDDSYAAIDPLMQEAFKKIDVSRKQFASLSL